MKIHMRCKLDNLAMYCREIHPIESVDLDQISNLLLTSYKNTVDWIEGSTHRDARAAVESALQGSFGNYQPQASGILLSNESLPVSAVLSSVYENEPFVIFMFTDPHFTNRGLATKLIRHAAAQFLALDFSSMHLYVSNNNPALHLYRNLGFLEQ